MTTTKLDKSEWKSFADRISKTLAGMLVEIEVASLSLGNQVEAAWLPMLGLTYDEKDDVLEIALDGLDHLIPHPYELYAETGPEGLSSLLVVDKDGLRQIVRLRVPLMLPAPSAAG